MCKTCALVLLEPGLQQATRPVSPVAESKMRKFARCRHCLNLYLACFTADRNRKFLNRSPLANLRTQVDTLKITDDDAAFILGKGGKTKEKTLGTVAVLP